VAPDLSGTRRTDGPRLRKRASGVCSRYRARRLLLSQAKQEARHALVFQGAVAWLAPRHLGETPLLKPLEEYRTLLDEAIVQREWIETVLAEQVILEGLGEAILNRIEKGLAKRAALFGRLPLGSSPFML
jgi:hypothetical protein